MLTRFEVGYSKAELDSRSLALSKKLSKKVQAVDVFWVKSNTIDAKELETAAREILLDPILSLQTLQPSFKGVAFERRFHPGMTDNRSRTFGEALHLYFPDVKDLEILSGDLILVEGASVEEKKTLEIQLKKTWVNPWIHTLLTFEAGTFQNQNRFQEPEIKNYFREVNPVPPAIEIIPLLTMNDSELQSFSERRLLALSLVEMKAVQKYFAELKRNPTDVELEIIAQTWSEHCKHKIFGAEVTYQGAPTPDGSKIPEHFKSLFRTTIADTTTQNKKPWLMSVFSDNAGIVAFTDDDAVCLKVETHNSPSALDPFGGAITGIVGVNRDILGTGIGARPVFNTNVFCVGPAGFQGSLPEKMHHPQDLLEGVRFGVEEGGNQSGIPTVNGAVYFDESYMGKPLIFVGSGGVMPRKINGRPIEEKKAFPGDLIYMVGGRIGKDGIHGATFSSLELNDQMPSSVVQLGDPITQKRMTDFLLRARDQSLIQALTDNGAGGLSSSVGEIANLTGGARIELANAKSKYPGMAAWELVVSESQERMTVVIRPENKKNFELLARLFEVEISLIGEMTASGTFEVTFHSETVSQLTLDFLHEQAPKLNLTGSWNGSGLKRSQVLKTQAPLAGKNQVSVVDTLKCLMSRPNIASKEWIIRQYDHEVQGCSVIKPLQTAAFSSANHGAPRSSPNNAGVQRIKVDSDVGSVISCGMNPELSLIDPYLMAQAAVDEAVRNALCVGAEFSTENHEAVFSLVDNFCWPDPTKDTEVMGALVRTCFGMRNAAMELKLPFISGKDSMKNDFRGVWDGKSVHIAVLPTLLVSALARIKNVTHARSSEFKTAGDLLYLIGPSASGLLGSEWSKLGIQLSEAHTQSNFPLPHWGMARQIYNWLGSEKSHVLKSLHDLSDGGLLVAIAECGFARNLGATLHLDENQIESEEFLFGEGFHRFVGTIDSRKQKDIEAEWNQLGIPFTRLGEVASLNQVQAQSNGKVVWGESLDTLYDGWKKGAQS